MGNTHAVYSLRRTRQFVIPPRYMFRTAAECMTTCETWTRCGISTPAGGCSQTWATENKQWFENWVWSLRDQLRVLV